MKQVLIVAAEASSSLFAQRLLEHWRQTNADIQAFGVGSFEMEKLGFQRLGKAEEMAVVGAAEVIEHYSHLKAVFRSLVDEAKIRRPRFALVMDYPEFNIMLAKELKALGIPVVYYISPQVWAWRKSRVHKIKARCEEMLVLFPFETSFYEQHQMKVQFVGHPILDELDEKYFDPRYRDRHRAKYGLHPDDFVVGLMPGSRTSEINQHLDLQLEVARRLSRRFSQVKIVLMVAPSRTKEEIQERMGDLSYPLILLKDDPNEMIHLCDSVLAASGTATLMVALLEKPMVIMYRLKWLTGLVARLLVHGVKFFGLPNLIAGFEVVPERWQGGANPEELTRLMARFIEDPEQYEKTKADLKSLKSKLGEKGATLRVAAALEKYLRQE